MRPFLKTFAIYALLGPPLTGLACALAMWVCGLATDPNFSAPPYGPLHHAMMLAGYAVPLSYVAGGAQAVFVGLAAAVWQRWHGLTPATVPLVLSLLAWFGATFFTSSLWQGNGFSFSDAVFSSTGAFWLANHLFAGGIGWWLVKRWVERPT